MRLTAVFLMIFFAGCMTAKKQQRIAEQYYAAHPDSLAKECMENYPPKTGEIKEGETKTVTVIQTDTAAVNRLRIRIDSLLKKSNVPVVAGVNVDSIRAKIRSILIQQFTDECKSLQVLQIRVDTLPVADSAAIKYWYGNYMNERDKRNQVEGQLQTALDDVAFWKAKARKRMWIMFGLIAFIGLATFLRIKRIL